METWEFPLSAYLDRIRYAGRVAPDEHTLVELQQSQLATIPFENFDILLGRGISLAAPALIAKLIDRPRGGYCFELNGLFLLALQAIGFAARPLLARVQLRGPTTRRTHALLLVEIGGRSWIADVGFGGPSLRAPVPLELDVPRRQQSETFRLVDAGALGTMLQMESDAGWRDLYAFDLAAAVAADLKLANEYTATSPESRFTQTRVAAVHSADGRTTLENMRLRQRVGGVVREEILAEGSAYLEALSRYFGIELDASYASLKPLLAAK